MSPRYSLDRRLGGPQNLSGRWGGRETSCPCRVWMLRGRETSCPCRESNPVCPARSSSRRHGHRSVKNTRCTSASGPDRFTPGERAPGTHLIGGWVGPRSGLDVVEKRNILPLPGNASMAQNGPKRKHYPIVVYGPPPKVKVTIRPTISRSVHHGVEPHLGLMTRY
jgi:hypothetical protein